VALGLGPCPIQAAEVLVRLQGGGEFHKPVQTFRDRRYRKVIPQSLDFSCGAAALATVLRYHFGYQVIEKDAIVGMWRTGDKEQIRKRGFSMLDMKNYCVAGGLEATGFRLEDIEKLKGKIPPLITVISTRNYKHFVVIRKVEDGNVYISDPALGNRAINVDEFNQSWIKTVFLVSGKTKGNPEGLFEEDRTGVRKDEVLPLTRGSAYGRLAMDGTMSIVFSGTIPLVGLGTIGIR